jgi:DNA-binding MarR family transcriptional regulator
MPKRDPGSGRAEPAHDRTLLFAMVRLVNLAARPFQEGIGRSHRLGLSEWRALAVLSSHPGSTATEIAQRTGLDKMTVSRALASLEQAGRVARRPDRSDGRRALATLTPAGRRLFEALRGEARAREAVVTGMLSEPERQRLLAIVGRMTDALLAADAGVPADPNASPNRSRSPAGGAAAADPLNGSRTGRPAPASRRPTTQADRSSPPGPRPTRAPARRTGSRG